MARVRADSCNDRTEREPSARLVELTYELLDAGFDTLELLDRGADTAGTTVDTMSLGWALHADYLRALQRRGREIVAAEAASSQPQLTYRASQRPQP